MLLQIYLSIFLPGIYYIIVYSKERLENNEILCNNIFIELIIGVDANERQDIIYHFIVQY